MIWHSVCCQQPQQFRKSKLKWKVHSSLGMHQNKKVQTSKKVQTARIGDLISYNFYSNAQLWQNRNLQESVSGIPKGKSTCW